MGVLGGLTGWVPRVGSLGCFAARRAPCKGFASVLGWGGTAVGRGICRRMLDAAVAVLEQPGSKQEFERPPWHPKSFISILLFLPFLLSFPPTLMF